MLLSKYAERNLSIGSRTKENKKNIRHQLEPFFSVPIILALIQKIVAPTENVTALIERIVCIQSASLSQTVQTFLD